MDESAQQAVQLGVNLTVFILALTLSITLLMKVRDVADLALEYDASIPTGSRIFSVEEHKQRVVSGNELLAYYVNYMTDLNNERTKNFTIKIIDGASELRETVRSMGDYNEINNDIIDIKKMFNDNGIDLSKDYEVITEKYDEQEDGLLIILKSIETE